MEQYNELCRWLPVLSGFNFSDMNLVEELKIKINEILPLIEWDDIRVFMEYYLHMKEMPLFESLTEKNNIGLLVKYKKVA